MNAIKIPDEFDVVITHQNCYDGHTAAWVASKHSPGATFFQAQHGDKPPKVDGKRVLIADFSYPKDVLLGMAARAEEIVVLDHHKSAKENLEELDFAYFDMQRSGAGLTWDFLMGSERPSIVNHVEDRDLWRFAIGGTREFHAAMSTYEMTFENWDRISEIPWAVMVGHGSKILEFIQLTAKKLASRAKLMKLGDTEVWMVNTPVEFVSETAEVLKNREPHVPVLGWMWDGERGDFYCSLRSREDGPDVSQIAREYGGGGHKHAAGFRSKVVPTES